MNPLAEQLWRLEKVVALSQSASAAAMAPIDDSLEEVLLSAVAVTPGIHPSDLARHLAVTRPAISKRLRHLESAGSVELRPDPHDGRRTTVHLTESGRSRLRRQQSLRGTNAERYVRDWQSGDASALVDLLTRLVDEIEAEHQRARPGWAYGPAGVPADAATDETRAAAVTDGT